MDPIRRIVAGVDEDGVSRVVEDSYVQKSWDIGGKTTAAMWELPVPYVPDKPGGDAVATPINFVPAPGNARFLRVVIPPEEQITLSREEAHALANKLIAGRAKYFREDGLHATPTLDVFYVAQGSAELVLEDSVVTVKEGECVVQRGVWHGWRNPGDVACVLVGVNFA